MSVSRFLFLIAVLLSAQAHAQIRPTPGAGDPRLQNVVYDPNQVVQLDVSPGFQLTVAFGEGERIETIALGDGAAWQVTPNKRGNLLFIKASNASTPTNLSVVTDSRIYQFELFQGNGYGGSQAYMVRFDYPRSQQASTATQLASGLTYRVKGAKRIRPMTILVEDNQTIITWREDQPLPATFQVDDGQEMLVNSTMQDGNQVIIGAPAKLLFRLDRLQASALLRKAKDRSR